jgi:hypothetical protein
MKNTIEYFFPLEHEHHNFSSKLVLLKKLSVSLQYMLASVNASDVTRGFWLEH